MNQFSGSIPTNLGGLRELQVLDLDSNEQSGGIPASLGNLSELEVLTLSENPTMLRRTSSMLGQDHLRWPTLTP